MCLCLQVSVCLSVCLCLYIVCGRTALNLFYYLSKAARFNFSKGRAHTSAKVHRSPYETTFNFTRSRFLFGSAQNCTHSKICLIFVIKIHELFSEKSGKMLKNVLFRNVKDSEKKYLHLPPDPDPHQNPLGHGPALHRI